MSDQVSQSIPHVPLPGQTLLMENNEPVLRIDGLLVLPHGARINLDQVSGTAQLPLSPERFPTGRADAVVVGVRLWGALSDASVLVLEVQLVGVEEPPLPVL